MVAYQAASGAVCLSPRTQQSVVVTEHGRIEPHYTWPRPISGELPFGERGAAVAQPGTDLNRGMRAIKDADASFDPKTFVEGAKLAYEMIVMAYADGDRRTLKNLLSREVYEGFVAAIDERERRSEKIESSFVGIDKAAIVGAEMKGSEAHVTLRIVSELISATRDSAGSVIDGDPETVAEVKDVWTFARDTRSRDPNWKLVATEAEE
jgi:predicted lipid-binding transport protein (Tim44 family)